MKWLVYIFAAVGFLTTLRYIGYPIFNGLCFAIGYAIYEVLSWEIKPIKHPLCAAGNIARYLWSGFWKAFGTWEVSQMSNGKWCWRPWFRFYKIAR